MDDDSNLMCKSETERGIKVLNFKICKIKRVTIKIYCNSLIIKWRRWDSNPRPLDCQSSTLAS